MNVIFVEPSFPSNQRQFVRALHATGNRVIGVGERPYDWFDDELKSWLGAYEQISSVTDEAALEAAVRRVQAREWVDRLEATVEAHVLTAAKVREATGIPGLPARAAWLCRDKVALLRDLVPARPCRGVDACAYVGTCRCARPGRRNQPADLFFTLCQFPVFVHYPSPRLTGSASPRSSAANPSRNALRARVSIDSAALGATPRKPAISLTECPSMYFHSRTCP